MTDPHDLPGHLIRRLQQIAVSAFTTRIGGAGFDLTPVQFGALAILDEYPGIDQATLAGMIAYDRVTIGGVVDRLVEKGYVSRSVSTLDRRARLVTLTDTGRDVLAAVAPIVHSAQGDIVAPLTQDEQRVFMALLRKLTE